MTPERKDVCEACETLLEVALPCIVAALERNPELAARVAAVFTAQGRSAAPELSVAFMSVEQYAAHRCLGERSIRYALQEMTEGQQFYRSGRKGGRIVINVAAADAWYAQRGSKKTTALSDEQLAVDEVTRRRARVALKKRKES